MDFLRTLLLGLVPPADWADQKQVRHWSVNVSITLGLLTMATTIGFALAFGFMTFIFPGFALASDVSDTKTLIQQVRVGQLDTEIFNAHQAMCDAIIQKNRDLAIQWSQRVQQKLPQYQRLNNGQPYQLQGCPGSY